MPIATTSFLVTALSLGTPVHISTRATTPADQAQAERLHAELQLRLLQRGHALSHPLFAQRRIELEVGPSAITVEENGSLVFRSASGTEALQRLRVVHQVQTHLQALPMEVTHGPTQDEGAASLRVDTAELMRAGVSGMEFSAWLDVWIGEAIVVGSDMPALRRLCARSTDEGPKLAIVDRSRACEAAKGWVDASQAARAVLLAFSEPNPVAASLNSKNSPASRDQALRDSEQGLRRQRARDGTRALPQQPAEFQIVLQTGLGLQGMDFRAQDFRARSTNAQVSILASQLGLGLLFDPGRRLRFGVNANYTHHIASDFRVRQTRFSGAVHFYHRLSARGEIGVGGQIGFLWHAFQYFDILRPFEPAGHRYDLDLAMPFHLRRRVPSNWAATLSLVPGFNPTPREHRVHGQVKWSQSRWRLMLLLGLDFGISPARVRHRRQQRKLARGAQ